MSIKEFTAYQPLCDAEGCRYVPNGEYEEWFLDPAGAIDAWRANDDWTDGTAFFCQTHAITEPHAHIADPNDLSGDLACARCRISLDEHEVPA